jgi:hypothetical protein
MPRLAETILGALRAELHARRAWDEPPALYLLNVARGVASLSELPIPGDMWALGRPADILAGIAAMTSASPATAILRRHAAPGLHGAAFRAEAWGASLVGADAPAARELRAAAGRHELYRHPARIELRFMYAVDRAGITYSVQQPRDPANDEMPHETVSYPRPGPDGYQVAGAIPEALDAIVSALLGVSLAPRAEPPD